MFTVMVYSIKLAYRKEEYQSAMSMTIAGLMAVVVGIIFSVIFSLILCFAYIPNFFAGTTPDNFLKNYPEGQNYNNTVTLFQIFVPAVLENFGAGAFMAVLISFVVKRNQTKDKPV
jgi:ABC-type phosphate/phosphonate transport system permease subunit